MKTPVKMFIVLTAITVLSGGVLAGLDSVTAPAIKLNRMKELKAAISDVLPKYDYYDEIVGGKMVLYVGRNKGEEVPVGVAFRVIGNGFQGKISIMVGVKADFLEMTGLKVLQQMETPGLGTKIVEDPSDDENPYWFPDQFKGLKPEPMIEMVKNIEPTKPTEIQAISGATISSKAVVKILNENIVIAKKLYQSKQM